MAPDAGRAAGAAATRADEQVTGKVNDDHARAEAVDAFATTFRVVAFGGGHVSAWCMPAELVVEGVSQAACGRLSDADALAAAL